MEKTTSPSKPSLTILGAGVCGMYAAITALRSGCQVTLLEKNSYVGGLATAHAFGDNHFDTGVHMLHAFDKQIFQDVSGIMGDARIEVPLDARIRWGNTTYRYPLRFGDLVKEMPPLLLVRGVTGLLLAELKRAVSKVETKNAEDALIAFYGAPLYEFFFEEFTHKYWGIHPRELSDEFIRRKMPRLSAVDFIRQRLLGFLPNRKNLTTESSLQEETLHYSERGAKGLPEALKSEILKLGGVLHTGVVISSVKDTASSVAVTFDGTTVESDYVVSTMPLNKLLPLCDGVSDEVSVHAQSLRSKPIVIYGLLINKPNVLDGLYTYYRNRVFHRVGEPKNAGLDVTPKTATVLIVEMTCDEGDEKWDATPEARAQVIRDLKAEGICEEKDILEWHVMKHHHGYPIYDLGFEDHLAAVEEFIATKPRITSTGRQGAYTYPGMHTAMRMGAKAVDKFLERS